MEFWTPRRRTVRQLLSGLGWNSLPLCFHCQPQREPSQGPSFLPTPWPSEHLAGCGLGRGRPLIWVRSHAFLHLQLSCPPACWTLTAQGFAALHGLCLPFLALSYLPGLLSLCWWHYCPQSPSQKWREVICLAWGSPSHSTASSYPRFAGVLIPVP